MTRKQQRFVEEYLVDLNATQAAIRAGYSERTAYSIGIENLKKPVIAVAVEAAMDDLAARTAVTQESVVAMLQESRDDAREAGQHSAAIKAAELLGKITGHFTDKVHITGDVSLVDILTGAAKLEDDEADKASDDTAEIVKH